MNCLYCPPDATRCDTCDPPRRGGLMDRFPGAMATQRASARLGFHPMGHAMPIEGPAVAETCGSCAHAERRSSRSGAKTWIKCGLAEHTHGRASDTRARWPACARWRSHEAARAEAEAERAARAS